MKTPMQEVIDDLKQLQDVISFSGNHYIQKLTADLIQRAESKLEKEKEVMCEFADDYQRNCFQKSADDYFKETFKTKER